MESSRLCLVNDSTLFSKVEDVDIDSIYLKVPKILRGIRYLHLKSNAFRKFRYIWLGKWRRNISKYNKIIIFDSIFDYSPLEYIRTYNKTCKVYFCYRNRVFSKIVHGFFIIDPKLLKEKYGLSVYSYNQEDCEKYGLNYYSQFHRIPEELIKPNQYPTRDIYFIGLDKGRFNIVQDLAKQFYKLGLTYKIGIVPDKGSDYALRESPLISKQVSYNDIICECLNSRCILDITTESNNGITYRVLEALVLKRKLITNNQLITYSEFYDNDNTFIIGVDNPLKLMEFIKKPYIDRHQKQNFYSFKYFCETIFNQ